MKVTVLTGSSSYLIFSLGYLRCKDVYRRESTRCCSLPFFLTLSISFIKHAGISYRFLALLSDFPLVENYSTTYVDWVFHCFLFCIVFDPCTLLTTGLGRRDSNCVCLVQKKFLHYRASSCKSLKWKRNF